MRVWEFVIRVKLRHFVGQYFPGRGGSWDVALELGAIGSCSSLCGLGVSTAQSIGRTPHSRMTLERPEP